VIQLPSPIIIEIKERRIGAHSFLLVDHAVHWPEHAHHVMSSRFMATMVSMLLIDVILLVASTSASSTTHLQSKQNMGKPQTLTDELRLQQRLLQKEEQYEILSSAALFARLQKLSQDYPTFCTLTTTQEWFGLPRAGNSADCTFDRQYHDSSEDDTPGCNNYVLVLQDKEAYPEDPDVQLLSEHGEKFLNLEGGYWKQPADGDESGEQTAKSGWKYVPDVFLSGSVHGNERVGPTSLLEMSELLLEAAYCESLPRMKYKPKQSSGKSVTLDNEHDQSASVWEQELMTAKNCRQSLDEKGISSPLRQWLARLVSTRRTVIIPTANALGYARNQREEDGIDPNRDFPFDVQQKTDCMQTVAGRSINELFRSHLFPIGLTFHGGMEVIGFEWGAPTYLNKDAPDAVAQETIAGAYSRYANGFPNHVAYDYGTMNEKVYYVRGGMEDWAFAGSWDPDRVIECQPLTFGGYPAEKTRYNNSTLRAFNMLIETSNKKEPTRDSLGKRTQPLVSSSGEENGHIARNIRLALLAMDVVEPYVSIRGVEGLELEDDVVPAVNPRRYDGSSYLENSKMLWLPESGRRRRLNDLGLLDKRRSLSSSTTITWTVGGSFDIDATELVYGSWDALPSNLADATTGFYPSLEALSFMQSNEFTTAPAAETQGRSRWHSKGAYPISNDDDINPTFEATIDLSKYPPGSKIAVFAKAKVDKAWLNPAANVGPSILGPVSHIVNARANPSYFATNAGKIIRGRQDSWWYSAPVTLVVGSLDEEDEVVKDATLNNVPLALMNGHATAVHLNSRMGGSSNNMLGRTKPPSVAQPKSRNRAASPITAGASWLTKTIGLLAVLAAAVMFVVRRWRRYAYRRQLDQIAEEEDGFAVEIPSEDRYHDDEEEEGGSPREGHYSID
jgi:hypothetical protein